MDERPGLVFSGSTTDGRRHGYMKLVEDRPGSEGNDCGTRAKRIKVNSCRLKRNEGEEVGVRSERERERGRERATQEIIVAGDVSTRRPL